MAFKKFSVLLLTYWVGMAAAQIIGQDPDWKESDAPPPPTFSQVALIPLNMPSYVSMKFGIDPKTLSITEDGIVRYVVVASNESGSVTAMYEGIRCNTAQMKTYARFNSSGEWEPIKEPKWSDLGGQQRSNHAMVIARQGLCDGAARTGQSAADIENALKK